MTTTISDFYINDIPYFTAGVFNYQGPIGDPDPSLLSDSNEPPAGITGIQATGVNEEWRGSFVAMQLSGTYVHRLSVDLKYFVWSGSGPGPTSFRANLGPSDVDENLYLALVPELSYEDYVSATVRSPWYFTDWDDQNWTQETIEDLHLFVKVMDMPGTDPFNDAVIIASAWINLELIQAPVASIISPFNGELGASIRPMIKWSYSGDGEPQYKYQVKVFEAATVAVGGFDPDTSPDDVYDSGWITSSKTEHEIPAGSELDPFTIYYAYVRLAKNPNFGGAVGRPDLQGRWSFSIFRTSSLPLIEVTGPFPVTTRKPFLGIGYADVEGDAAGYFEMKVFTDAVVTGGGFDPETSPAVAESGVTIVTDPTFIPSPTIANVWYWRPPEPLVNGDYHQYARMAQGKDMIWSLWDSFAWTQDVVLVKPAPPILTAVPDEANARVVLTITRGATGVQPDLYDIHRLGVDGATWEPVRGIDMKHEYADSEVHTFYDYESPPNRIYTYRAVMYDSTTLDDEPSDPTDYSGILKTKTVWLKDLDDPSLNMSFLVADTWLGRSEVKARSVRRALDRELPVVVRGVGRGETFPMKFTLLGRERYEQFRSIIDANKTIFLQTSKTQWHVDVQSVSTEEHLWDELREEPEGGAWYVTCSFLEVDGED